MKYPSGAQATPQPRGPGYSQGRGRTARDMPDRLRGDASNPPSGRHANKSTRARSRSRDDSTPPSPRYRAHDEDNNLDKMECISIALEKHAGINTKTGEGSEANWLWTKNMLTAALAYLQSDTTKDTSTAGIGGPAVSALGAMLAAALSCGGLQAGTTQNQPQPEVTVPPGPPADAGGYRHRTTGQTPTGHAASQSGGGGPRTGHTPTGHAANKNGAANATLPREASGTASQGMTCLYVGGLSASTTQEGLESSLRQLGHLVSLTRISNQSKSNKYAFAHAEFATTEAAHTAVTASSQGRGYSLEWATNSKPTKQRPQDLQSEVRRTVVMHGAPGTPMWWDVKTAANQAYKPAKVGHVSTAGSTASILMPSEVEANTLRTKLTGTTISVNGKDWKIVPTSFQPPPQQRRKMPQGPPLEGTKPATMPPAPVVAHTLGRGQTSQTGHKSQFKPKTATSNRFTALIEEDEEEDDDDDDDDDGDGVDEDDEVTLLREEASLTEAHEPVDIPYLGIRLPYICMARLDSAEPAESGRSWHVVSTTRTEGGALLRDIGGRWTGGDTMLAWANCTVSRIRPMGEAPFDNDDEVVARRQASDKEFRAELSARGLEVVEQAGDGNCLFHCIAHILSGQKDHAQARQEVCDQLETMRGHDSITTEYIANMRYAGTSAGHQEIAAAQHKYNIRLVVHDPYAAGGMAGLTLENDTDTSTQPLMTAHISYHRGGHYNMLKPRPTDMEHQGRGGFTDSAAATTTTTAEETANGKWGKCVAHPCALANSTFLTQPHCVCSACGGSLHNLCGEREEEEGEQEGYRHWCGSECRRPSQPSPGVPATAPTDASENALTATAATAAALAATTQPTVVTTTANATADETATADATANKTAKAPTTTATPQATRRSSRHITSENPVRGGNTTRW